MSMICWQGEFHMICDWDDMLYGLLGKIFLHKFNKEYIKEAVDYGMNFIFDFEF